jgi:GWxTD domain-containing protein
VKGTFSLLPVLVALLLPVPGATQALDDKGLPEKYRTWLEQEVVYVITERERGAFQELRSNEERDAFIEAFWKKRDPDPLTPVNEFREEHYRRIEYANRELGRETPIPGWMTDRGKMYIILGAPRDREKFLAAPDIYPAELWFYDARPEQGLSSPFYLLFFQEGFAGEFRLYSPRVHGPEKLFPAIRFDPGSHAQAYEMLENISADLAHASITFRADESGLPGLADDSLSTDLLLADIYRSPQRRIDTAYVDAIERGRGVVETAYLFNYVPSAVGADVLAGPPGLDYASFVHWAVEIDPQNLTLVFDEDKKVYYTTLEIHAEVTTADDGISVARFDREEYVELSRSQFAAAMTRPFAYRSMFPLVPGTFGFRVVLKNRARSQYTIAEMPISVPERPPGEVAVSPPILLYEESANPPEAPRYRPYGIGPLALDPNTRRIVSIGQSLMAAIFLSGASANDRVRSRVIDRETSQPLAIDSELPAPAEPYLVESVPLAGLGGGRYRLAVALVDARGAELAGSSVDFDVSPRTSLPRPWSMSRMNVDPSRPGEVESELAGQYLRLGDRRHARALFERAVAASPGSSMPRLVLARFALEDSDPRRAIELLEPVATVESEDREALRTLGDAYYQSGNPAAALAPLERVLALGGPDASLLNALAACQKDLGNGDKAASYLEQSLRLSPDQQQVRALLEQLRSRSR